MKKKTIIILIILIIAIISCSTIWFFITYNNQENAIVETSSISIDPSIKDNSQVIKTNSNSTIRNINFYDKSLFEGQKCILIMWGSWCPNCAEEFNDLEEIVNYYKKKDIRVVLISHDYELATLVNFVEREDIDYNTEIYLDLERVIRRALDPEASTVPVSYFLDENTNVVKKHDEIISLNQVQNIVKELGW